MKKLIVLLLSAFLLSGCQSFLDYAKAYHESVTEVAYKPEDHLAIQTPEEYEAYLKRMKARAEYNKKFEGLTFGTNVPEQASQLEYFDVIVDGRKYHCMTGTVFTECK